MPNSADHEKMSTADPRHRSFHLTPTTSHTAQPAPREEAASGWVRLIDSHGVSFALRIDTVTAVVGPYVLDDGWAVKILCGETAHEPVLFTDEKSAEVFVEDLLFDD